FRIGQQHAEKGQAAALGVVVMIPDVVRLKAVVFQDLKIIIEIVRVIIAAAAGKKSAPQQQPRGDDNDQDRADFLRRCAALPQRGEAVGERTATGEGDMGEMPAGCNENYEAQSS